MKELVEEYYTEPEKITVSSAQSEAKERKVDDKCGWVWSRGKCYQR